MFQSKISENAIKVLERRYLIKDSQGNAVETVEDLFRRVATSVALADKRYDENADSAATADKFYELMSQLKFLPNSPTLMNAGRPLGQLSACFVLPVEDSMEGIFEAIKQAALIHKSGGGTGFSFSRLRPTGAAVNTTGGVASGPISFMRVFNMATEAVKQGGTRRGANMGILRIDHPDILEFINCKQNNADITNFNISVGITEEFMNKVESGGRYDLIDPKTKEVTGSLDAGEIFDKIVTAAHHNGEPGIIFLDRLNKDNVVPSQGDIESTNPCGEQPLLPYESCNLGSVNLANMLKTTENGIEIDYDLLDETVTAAVHFLDNVIDINNYPLDKIATVTRQTRKIGLGVMGFADALLLLGVPYNSDAGVELGEKIMTFINEAGHRATKQLAIKRGPFPLFYESIFKDGDLMRNGTVTTIAPTGTLSIIAGCSSGVEPVFGYVYIRNVMDGTEMIEVNGILKEKLEELGIYSDDLMRKIADEGTIAHIDEIPQSIRDVFVCAHDISPIYHAKMQAAFQRATDNAVSKTVNFPSTATKEEVAEVYMLTYREGCKGVTIYRDGSRDSQVLNIGSVNNASNETSVEGVQIETLSPQEANVVASGSIVAQYGKLLPRPRPEITSGFTEKVKIGCGNLYITVNYDEHGICEVFTATGKAGGCPSQSAATARLMSVALRSGMDIGELYDQLKGIRCPSTVRQSGMACTSCPDAIAKVVMKVDRFIKEGQVGLSTPDPEQKPIKTIPSRPVIQSEEKTGVNFNFCPECGATVQHEGGCVLCRGCGFSKCG